MTAQSQASVTEQLAKLHVLGIQHGLYDAVDWLTSAVERQAEPSERSGEAGADV